MKAGILGWAILGVFLWVPVSGAQKTVPKPAAPSKASSGPQTGKAPAAPASSEDSGKRRDPFNSLIIAKKPESGAPIQLPPGTKGLVIGQLQLQGIVRSIEGKWIAVVDNKSKRAYFLREKDQLYNGVVSKITANSVVFLETGTDAQGKTVSREVVKKLTSE